MPETIILGAGMCGMSAGITTKFPVYEAASGPGGTCFSYYVDVNGNTIAADEDTSECFRFEPAGGHWLFGVSETMLSRIKKYSAFKNYGRKANIYFSDKVEFIPFPIQENLRYLDATLKEKILEEIIRNPNPSEHNIASFREWLKESFGETLCDLFFYPFNEKYTAGYLDLVKPQDLYKSRINVEKVIEGSQKASADEGYNTVFYYPLKGLDQFITSLSKECKIYYNHRAVEINTEKRIIYFSNNNMVSYDKIISTVPLNKMMEITNTKTGGMPDPSTSVLVINAGVVKGKCFPDVHWSYIPFSKAGMHRVGFYSNVDVSFLPHCFQKDRSIGSIYIEKSFKENIKPDEQEIKQITDNIIRELMDWNFIKDVIVVDTKYTAVAYTWSWKGSGWKENAIRALEEKSIVQTGRYGSWKFQGMINSIKQGFSVDTHFDKKQGF